MPEFYPIREATTVTGVSVTTLRRFIRAIVADDQHPDRDQLLLQERAAEGARARTCSG